MSSLKLNQEKESSRILNSNNFSKLRQSPWSDKEAKKRHILPVVLKLRCMLKNIHNLLTSQWKYSKGNYIEMIGKCFLVIDQDMLEDRNQR